MLDITSILPIFSEDKFSLEIETATKEKTKLGTAHNNAQAASAHFPVRSGGSAQTAFQVGLAVQIEFRAARTSLDAYVRLLSTHLHGMLRTRAPGHL